MSLDRLTILTRTKATELGIQLKEARSGFRLEQSGLAGQVFATLADKLAELGTEKQINHAEIQMTVAGVDTSALRTLLSVVPMLPRHEFTVRMLGAATFDGLSGDVSVSRLTGLSKDFRKVEKTIMDLWDKAADLTVDIALIYSPPEPVDPDRCRVVSAVLHDRRCEARTAHGRGAGTMTRIRRTFTLHVVPDDTGGYQVGGECRHQRNTGTSVARLADRSTS